MPQLAAWLGTLFSGVLGFFLAHLGKRAANYAALTAATAAAFAALWLTVTGLVAGLQLVMPAFIVIPLSWVLPGNLTECVSVYLAVQTALAGYRWHKETVRAASYVL